MNTRCRKVVVLGVVVGLLVLLLPPLLPPAAGSMMTSETELQDRAVEIQQNPGHPVMTVPIGLQPFAVGGYYLVQDRDLVFEGADSEIGCEMRSMVGWLSFDIVPWLTAQAALGASDVEFDGESRLNGDLAWGVGLQARLAEHPISRKALGPSLGCCLDASVQYLNGGADKAGLEVEWQEFCGSLVFSLVNKPGDPDTVRSVALFAGPMVSWIDGEASQGNESRDFDEDQGIGVTTGLAVVPRENVSVKIEAQFFGQMSYGAGVGFHF